MKFLRNIILSVTINMVLLVTWNSLEVLSARPWTYKGSKRWSKTYPDCSGSRQSPIDIDTSQLNFDDNQTITLSNFGAMPKSVNLANDGHTLEIRFEFDDGGPTVSGGPINDVYKLDHVNFRWDRDNRNTGSEHTVGMIPYGMEMQAIFIKSDASDFNEAMEMPNGLAAIAYLLLDENEESTLPETPGMDIVTKNICFVRRSGQSVDLDPFPFSSLLQEEVGDNTFFGYIVYSGSLSFPPCTENVLWMLSSKVHYIAKDQIDDILDIVKLDNNDHKNNRPPEPLNDRSLIIYNILQE